MREKYPRDFVIKAARELVDPSRSEYTREMAGLMFQSIVKKPRHGGGVAPWDTLTEEERRDIRSEIMESLAT